MRFRMFILSFLLSIAFLATIAFCVNWDNPDSQNVDEMLSSGEVYIYNSPIAGQAATPHKQREIEENKSSMNWTMPSTLSGGGDSAKSSRDLAESTASEAAKDTAAKETATAADTSATAQSELPPSEPTAASVSGSWSLTLIDNIQRDLVLSIFQNGRDVFGVGNIKVDNKTLQVAVSGSVQDETMEIDIISLGTIGLYKLNMDLNGESVTGDYQAFFTSGESLTGSAEGLKTA